MVASKNHFSIVNPESGKIKFEGLINREMDYRIIFYV